MSETNPIKIKDKNSEEIDLSFLPDGEKVVWQSTGWVKYSEIMKSSLRTLLITSIIALTICAGISILVALYAIEDSWHLVWLLPVVYIAFLCIAISGQGLFVAFGPFAFIPILKYKKTYTTDELNPYHWFKVLTTENIIFKEVDIPTKKWSDHQKECFKIEGDRVICPIDHIKEIVIQPGVLGYYHFRVYGKMNDPKLGPHSKQNRLLKWELSAKEFQDILFHLYTMEKEGKISLLLQGTDTRIIFGLLFLIIIIGLVIGIF